MCVSTNDRKEVGISTFGLGNLGLASDCLSGHVMDELGGDGFPQRKRVSKACDRCRRRKDRCDGNRPRCGTCEQSAATCSWNPSSKKRGLPDGYVRGLEKICGAIIREVPGVEDLLLTKFSGDEGALYNYWADDDKPNSPLALWKKSRLVKELDRFLPVLDSLTKKGKKRTWEDSEGLLTNQIPVPSPKHIQSGTISSVEENKPPGTAPHEPEAIKDLSADPSDLVSSSNDWTLPSSAGRLVEAYFCYTHMWFPIVERHDLLRVLYQGPRIKVTRSPGDNATLWAILAYAEAQYDIISSSEHRSDSSADLFYNRAKGLIPVVDGEYELGHVQAILILIVLKIGQDDWKAAWVLVGHAVRLAVNLGLNLIPSDSEQSKTRRRKHVFLGCFVLDTLVAARFGRLPHLRSQDAESVGVIDEEGLEEWDHWNDCLGIRRDTTHSLYQATTLSTFNNLVHLVRIHNDLICFGAARSSGPQANFNDRNGGNVPSNEMAVFYRGIAARLNSWKASHSFTDENLALPSYYNLYLAYLSITMALYLRYPCNAPLIYLGQETIRVMESYAEKFGLRILPPIFEYCLKLAGECIAHSLNTSGSEILDEINWIEPWQQVTIALSEGWPVFQLSKSLTQSNSMTWNEPLKPKNPSQQSASKSNTAPAQSTPDFWQASKYTAPRVFLETTSHSFHSPYVLQQPQPQFRSFRKEPSLDRDPIFNEFDAMDVNLWSNTWEQSLLNLGLTGDGHDMDEDFRSIFGAEETKPENFSIVEQSLSNIQTKPYASSNSTLSIG